MKIAIQSNQPRGKEIISLLESFGGNNTSITGSTLRWKGDSSDPYLYYYIDENGYIQLDPCPKDYKPYTLEQFEKEFPFKVGDEVIALADQKSHKIIALEYYNDKLCYVLDNGFHYQPHTLTTYEKMKEERNVTLTLDKAKEWYKKGRELKEIALQAFSEKELNPLPRSWEEFCKRSNPVASWRYVIPTKYETLYKLEQLRDCWRQRNVPQEIIYKIRKVGDKYKIVYGAEDAFLSFCDNRTAEEFLKCFKDLIEQAGDLI